MVLAVTLLQVPRGAFPSSRLLGTPLSTTITTPTRLLAEMDLPILRPLLLLRIVQVLTAQVLLLVHSLDPI